jgi:hypothetical protein
MGAAQSLDEAGYLGYELGCGCSHNDWMQRRIAASRNPENNSDVAELRRFVAFHPS